MGNLPGCSGETAYTDEYESSLEDPNAPPQMSARRFFKELRNTGLEDLLAAHGGLLKVTKILPEDQARRTLDTFKRFSDQDWAVSKTTQAYDAPHFFFRYEGDALDDVKGFAHSLCPSKFPTFHGGKYLQGGLIAKHDDSLHFQIAPNDKNATARYPVGHVMFRKIAMIWYFTENWKEQYGGCLVDRQVPNHPKVIVPEFNSLVMFLVPRDHEVSQMHAGSPPRYTLFGWLSDDEQYLPGNPPHKAMQRARELEDESTTDDDTLDAESTGESD